MTLMCSVIFMWWNCKSMRKKIGIFPFPTKLWLHFHNSTFFFFSGLEFWNSVVIGGWAEYFILLKEENAIIIIIILHAYTMLYQLWEQLKSVCFICSYPIIIHCDQLRELQYCKHFFFFSFFKEKACLLLFIWAFEEK